MRKVRSAYYEIEECCGVAALEIQKPGKPILLFCPKCGRKWTPAECDPLPDDTLIYFETLGTCLEKVFQAPLRK